MRTHDVITWVLCVVLAAGLLTVAGSQLDYINAQREELKLISNEPLENAPPSLAFATVAMGAFRGLVVDILWMRADKLKEEGQFFDARQLAEWITTLQPRFAAVWDFHAWNMAYNISVAIPVTQPQERWRWVKNGYELLRDQGIEVNPKSILLYRQLAFIFQHKIAGVTDDAHKYYKLQLAEAMEPLVGGATNEDFEAMCRAPRQFEEIASDANVAPLIAALRSADSAFADDEKFVSNYLSLIQNPRRFDPEAFRVRDDFRGTTTLKKFDIFAKAYHLRKSWKLDVELMHELNQTYGPVDWAEPNKPLPLDWRHPDSHAMYWAVKGLRVAGTTDPNLRGEHAYSADEINADRMVNHSLQDLFRNGKIHIWETPGEPAATSSADAPARPIKDIFYRPDLRMFEPYHKQLLEVIDKYTDPNDTEHTSHQIGHRNMLQNAVLSFYQAGHRKQAGKIYDQLKRLYPRAKFAVSLRDFVRNRFLEELRTLDIFQVKEIVLMLLRESYFLYAIGSDTEAFGRENLAVEVAGFYRDEYPDDEYRIDLPPLARLRYLSLLDFLNDRQFRQSLRRTLLNRIEIERPQLYKELMQQRELIEQTQTQQQ
ncbi:MAG: hypothetical protein ACYTEL_10845 [Planctomycetota bacterium]